MAIILEIIKVRYLYRIETDSGRRWWVTGKDLAGLDIAAGREINPEVLHRQIILLQYPRALDAAVRMLAQRACSKSEIEKKLSSRHVDPEVRELVLYKLEKEGLLNDEEFSGQWIHYRQNLHYGNRRIRQELRAKGVPAAQIDKALLQSNEIDYLNQAVEMARKLLQRQKNTENLFAKKQKVIQSLVRRGYEWDIAKQALNLTSEEEE